LGKRAVHKHLKFSEILKVADHESKVKFWKFKMADPIWQLSTLKFPNLSIKIFLSYFT